MISFLLLAPFVIAWEWIYMKKRKMKRKTYWKVFTTLFLAIGYMAWIALIDESQMTSPTYLIGKLFLPVQHFLTLKGWRS